MKNWIILAVLVLIGFLIHHPSLKMSIYGDEWIDVYQYHTHTLRDAHFSPLPGPLTYLAPYGFGILLVGGLYEIFGTNYFLYFVVSLLFRIFAAFAMYLLCLEIPISPKITATNKKILSFSISVFLLVGFTGLQNTDWIHYMNIYLATGFFLLGMLLQVRFFSSPTIKNLVLFIFCISVALITGTVRLFPIIFVIPFFDAYLYLTKKDNFSRKLVLIKMGMFGVLLLLLWAAGLFGSPFHIYSYGDWSIEKFLQSLFADPLLTLKAFLFWFGALVVPDVLITNQNLNILLGASIISVFIYSLIKIFSKENKTKLNWGFLFLCNLIIFIIATWYYGPTSFIGASHRYLFLIFVSFCIWLYVFMISNLGKGLISEKIIFPVMIILILTHAFAVRTLYFDWLDKGRDSSYIATVDSQLKKDFSKPIENLTIIYIETDDGSIKQSTMFGMAFKIAVFSKTWDDNLIPHVLDEKKVLIKKVEEQLVKGISIEDIVANVYGYEIQNKRFFSITKQIRAELLLL